MTDFQLTPKQAEAMELQGSVATHVALLGGARCVSGDTILDGHTKPIADLAKDGLPVEVLTSWGKQWAEPPFKKGDAALLKVDLSSGKSITVTDDHRFWSGSQWVLAKDLRLGDCLAVSLVDDQSCEPCLQGSNSALYLSGLLASARRWMKTPLGYLDRCFSHCRQYGQQLRLSLVSDQACHALQFDGQGRSLLDQDDGGRELDSHEGRSLQPASKYNLIGRWYGHLTKMGGFLSSCLGEQSSARASVQTCEPSQDLQKTSRLAGLRSVLPRWLLKVLDGFAHRCGQLFYFVFDSDAFSCDVPYVKGYSLEKVCSITRTAVQPYYTLHVPNSQQYFANGMLHHNSGKTFINIRTLLVRALATPKSRHAALRFRFNHIKSSIIFDTLPKVMDLCWPDLRKQSKLDKTDWRLILPNEAELWFGGLDDKERTEKILGQEFATIFLNECSQISWSSRNLVVSRLAQNVETEQGNPLRLKMFYDLNPPGMAHWTYRLFIEKRSPDTRKNLKDPNDYNAMLMNPTDNLSNLPPQYIKQLEELPPKDRERFLLGRFASIEDSALWTLELLNQCMIDGAQPDMKRIIIAVDPSGCSGEEDERSDEVGIIVAGLGVDNKGYVLEDLSGRHGPAAWGNIVAEAYERHEADCVVAEVNFGGAMVGEIVRAARPGTPFKEVRASRGKVARAEPVSTLYHQGKVVHCASMPDLEDQMCAMTTAGYTGNKSPDRADALVWALAELFPSMTRKKNPNMNNMQTQAITGNQSAKRKLNPDLKSKMRKRSAKYR